MCAWSKNGVLGGGEEKRGFGWPYLVPMYPHPVLRPQVKKSRGDRGFLRPPRTTLIPYLVLPADRNLEGRLTFTRLAHFWIIDHDRGEKESNACQLLLRENRLTLFNSTHELIRRRCHLTTGSRETKRPVMFWPIPSIVQCKGAARPCGNRDTGEKR